MNYQIAGVDSIIIYFGNSVSKEISSKVLSSYSILKKEKLDGVIELVSSYSSLYIQFDIFKYDHIVIYNIVKNIIENINIKDENNNSRLIKIPVYYSNETSLDLGRVSTLNNISVQDLIDIHSSTIYNVYAIGFSPAFAYMGDVDVKIRTPRLETPRKKIPKGSVAIADVQTAVYPQNSPGGWNIIGRTYIDMFDKSFEGFSYLKVGDKVKFDPITKDEYLKNGGLL